MEECDLNRAPDSTLNSNTNQGLSDWIKMNPLTPSAIDGVRRFCYLGTIEAPVYVSTTIDLVVESNFEALRELCEKISETELVECLKSMLNASNSEYLPRRDEALLVLAVYLSTRTDEKHRTVVRGHFTELVSCENDLFLFTKFVKRVQKLMERKTPFSRTVRKALLEWYNNQAFSTILHMWSRGETDCGVHRDLLHRCHYTKYNKFEPEVLSALRLLCTPLKELMKWPNYLDPIVKCKDTILGIAQLRLSQKSSKALPIVKKLSLSYEHVPRHLITDPQLLNFLLPKMSYEHLLQSWPRFLSILKLHRSAQRDFIQLFFEESKLRAANIEPICLLLQETRANKHKKFITKGVVKEVKPTFMHSLYMRSFGFNKGLGLRLHITLNLEMCYLGKSLTGRWRSINYLDAVVALAFGYYKCDPEVNVQIWYDKSGKLKPLPWNHTMSADEAKACCEAQEVVKIKQTLTDVIDNALEDCFHLYDVFLVIVPAATRGNPRNNSDRLCLRLNEYREKRNENAKFIIMSLRHHNASMKYSKESNEHILELCSLNEQTPRVIDAFAHGKFF